MTIFRVHFENGVRSTDARSIGYMTRSIRILELAKAYFRSRDARHDDIPFCEVCQKTVEQYSIERGVREKRGNLTDGMKQFEPDGLVTLRIECHGEEWSVTLPDPKWDES